jgi:hypothetical protein
MDLTGQRYGRLVVLEPIKKTPQKRRGFRKYWLCRCDCGNEKYVEHGHLRSGDTRSCGCLRREVSAARQRTHGYSHTRTHNIWQSMRQRCNNANAPAHSDYGGRGIQICDRWVNSFENFLADMGECPSDSHTIDRIDNNKGYSPENCRWATMKEQTRNTRRNRILEFDGKSLCLQEWAEITGLKRTTIAERINRGWTVEEALTTPILRRKFHANPK